MGLIIRWIVVAVVILGTALLFPEGIMVESFVVALIAAAVLGLINAVIRPLIVLVTLPINVVTLGLFTFIINAFLLWLTTLFVTGFDVANFWWALGLSFALSIVNVLIGRKKK